MVEYNPFNYDIHEDPYPTYRRLRDEAPVYRSEELDFYALSRWDDVWDATLDWRTFSSAQGVTIEAGREALPMIIMMDPPQHDRQRSLVAKAFTPNRIAALEEGVRSLTKEYLGEVGEAREFDAVEILCSRLPMDVISAMLNVPQGERERLRDLGNAAGFREAGNPNPPASAENARKELAASFPPLVEARRRDPGDDLVSVLIGAELKRENGRADRLSTEELLGFVQLLNIAGNETTAKFLSTSLYWLARYPEERQKLVNDPSLIPHAVEELLRFDTPSQYQGRVTTRHVELHGTRIPKGSRVLLLTGSANHDERIFEDPDRLDLERKFKMHLSFGYGHHFCVGKSLARLEMRVALEEFLARWPDYRVDEDLAERIHGGNVQRGFSRLPILI